MHVDYEHWGSRVEYLKGAAACTAGKVTRHAHSWLVSCIVVAMVTKNISQILYIPESSTNSSCHGNRTLHQTPVG